MKSKNSSELDLDNVHIGYINQKLLHCIPISLSEIWDLETALVPINNLIHQLLTSRHMFQLDFFQNLSFYEKLNLKIKPKIFDHIIDLDQILPQDAESFKKWGKEVHLSHSGNSKGKGKSRSEDEAEYDLDALGDHQIELDDEEDEDQMKIKVEDDDYHH
ncbi:hypothetical protein O181_004861 [Austropuccinia psidii MF-1]|uniref:Uncharacterized protein n=1 Tax=Austropuccinia psidii MF-1 TaxID=1389203 RepID=A0A9Q3GFE9_9BASI|nr:hypothetical protein [Austropuccinia psidii MF-1]